MIYSYVSMKMLHYSFISMFCSLCIHYSLICFLHVNIVDLTINDDNQKFFLKKTMIFKKNLIFSLFKYSRLLPEQSFQARFRASHEKCVQREYHAT